MRIVLFGATGMVGSGVLIECLDHPDVDSVVVVGRRTCGVQHERLEELVVADMFDLASIRERLAGLDACFFCLGVSAAGMSEADYHRITYDLTLAAARALVERNPDLVFCYVSGTGADSSEKGRVMWARVRGKIENALLEMPFKATWVFRPGYVQPVKGVRSRTTLYNVIYSVLGPLYPALSRLAPNYVTTTEKVGRAMINVVEHGAPKPTLENRDINRLAAL
jgi:uncharacterized protein YbjT (DUF2867 family)